MTFTVTAAEEKYLDVAVYSAIEDDQLIDRAYASGSAEISFDVTAGQTVYIQPKSPENQAFTYTMELTTTTVENVELTDDQPYTITPANAGEQTMLSFTAPADGQYLLASESSKHYYYIRDEWDTIYDNEYVEEAPFVSTEFLTLHQGQEVTLQYWFNDDTVSDEDYIHVTVSSLQDNDVLLDMTNNTATVSINPLDNQRILFTPTESGIYHFIADARDSESLITTEVLMQSETGEWYGRSGCAGRDAHYMYISYDCEANATYSFRVMPNTADWTGTANVSIVTLADVPIALDQANERSMTPDTFDFYQYQAEESGSYTLTLNSIQLGGNAEEDEPGVSVSLCGEDHQQIGDYWWWLHENESASFELEAGELVSFAFGNGYYETDVYFTFTLSKATTAIDTAGELTLDRVQTNVATETDCNWYSFTAPVDGTYLFSMTNEYGSEGEYMFEMFDSQMNPWDGDFACWCTDSYADLTYVLNAGDTVYARVSPCEGYGSAEYRLVVHNTDQPYNTDLLDGLAWQNVDDDYTAISSTGSDSFTLDVMLETTDDQWRTQAMIADFAVFAGNYYKLTFDMEAQTGTDMVQPHFMLQQNHAPYNSLSDYYAIDLDAGTYEYYFTAPETAGLAKLLFDWFWVGNYTFSNISLVRITEEEYQAWEDSQYGYTHETFRGTVTEIEPAWITLNITDADIMDVYEVVRIEGDVSVEMYEEDQSTDYDLFFGNGDDHWRVYTTEDRTLMLKVTSNGGDQDYKIHFVKFDRTETAVLEAENIGEIEPYSTDWYQFTAPQTGIYKFTFLGDSSVMNCEFYLDNMDGMLYDANAYWTDMYSTTLELDAGQVV